MAAKPTTTPATTTPAPMYRNPDKLATLVKAEWVNTDIDPRAATLSILDQVLSATTAEQIFADSSEGITNWGENINVPFTMTGNVKFLAAHGQYVTSDTIIPVFAIVEASDANGEPVILETGATKAVAQLKQAFDLDKLAGCTLVMTESDTRSGWKAQQLVLVKE